MTLIFRDREGNEINAKRFCDLTAEIGYRSVAHDHADRYRISTIWKGMEFHDEPRVFETIIFREDDQVMQHYTATEKEALAFHAEILGCLRIVVDPTLERKAV